MQELVTINVTWDEYSQCYLDIIKDNKGRMRMAASFSDLLTYYLQKQNDIKCGLVTNNNYINKSQPFWSGKYRCSHKLCDSIFYCRINNLPIENCPVTIEVMIKRTRIDHARVDKFLKIPKSKRLEIGSNIIANGLSNYYSEISIKNFSSNSSHPIRKLKK